MILLSSTLRLWSQDDLLISVSSGWILVFYAILLTILSHSYYFKNELRSLRSSFCKELFRVNLFSISSMLASYFLTYRFVQLILIFCYKTEFLFDVF